MLRYCLLLVVWISISLSAAELDQAANPYWTRGELALVTSQLSPGVMIHARGNSLQLFANLAKWGMGGPRNVAYAAQGSIKVESGAVSIPGNALSENWLLVWFAGAKGWERWDAPWLIVLQHRPEKIDLSENGLSIQSAQALEHVFAMPLEGLFKPDTSKWNEQLPEKVLAQCREWSHAARAFPVNLKESFKLDPEKEAITIRSAVSFLETSDDWKTPALKLAPVSPVLALAAQSKRLPIVFDKEPQDLNIVTPHGPLYAVRDAESYEVQLKLLSFITQSEATPKPDPNNAVQKESLARLTKEMSGVFSSGDGFFHQDFGDPKNFKLAPPQETDGGNTCWAVMAAQYPCRALAFMPPELLEKAKPRLQRYFADWILQEARFKPFREKLLLVGPGIGFWGGYDDAGKISTNTLLTLWTYAQNTGDWALIKERWPLIQKLFVTPRECTWRGFGRDAIAEIGDEAAPVLAMARLAYFTGDKETFAYASYIFARELIHHAVKQTGAGYFVQHQPFHSAEKMPENVYLTNLWGDIAGWQIDGPTWPEKTGERQYTNRWVRFSDPDVGRFHFTYFPKETRAELDGLMANTVWMEKNLKHGDVPHGMPSMIRLRSLLLNETPEELVKISAVNRPANSSCGNVAYCLAFLRPGGEPKTQELIPMKNAASDWAPGIEREYDPQRNDDAPMLTVNVSWQAGKGKDKTSGDPALTWYGWKPAVPDKTIPGGERCSFGQVLTAKALIEPKPVRLSWLTRAIVYEAK